MTTTLILHWHQGTDPVADDLPAWRASQDGITALIRTGDSTAFGPGYTVEVTVWGATYSDETDTLEHAMDTAADLIDTAIDDMLTAWLED